MTSPASIDVREVFFVNQAAEAGYEALPAEIGEAADNAIDAIQNNRALPPKMFRPLRGNAMLAGIHEIKLPYNSDTFRIYVTLICPYVVMVLDAGAKKSNHGGAIPSWQTERLEQRLKSAKDLFTNDEIFLKLAFERRAKLRAGNET
jgi:phage-related protein